MNYKGRRILVTGSSGFKGTWLSVALGLQGAEVWGIDTNFKPPMGFEGTHCPHTTNILDANYLADLIHQLRPDLIFHLAAQPIVADGIQEPMATFQTNALGTVTLLEVTRMVRPSTPMVIATTDKVYDPQAFTVSESSPLAGNCPYSASKVCAEAMIRAYVHSYRMQCSVVRCGNVIGGGDFGRFRLIPDFIRAVETGQPLRLRNPSHVRPWTGVIDAIDGYMRVGAMLLYGSLCDNYNLSGEAATVAELLNTFREAYGASPEIDACGTAFQEESTIRLDSSYAQANLGWKPRPMEEIAREAAEWYKAHREGHADLRALTESQIMARNRKTELV